MMHSGRAHRTVSSLYTNLVTGHSFVDGVRVSAVSRSTTAVTTTNTTVRPITACNITVSSQSSSLPVTATITQPHKADGTAVGDVTSAGSKVEADNAAANVSMESSGSTIIYGDNAASVATDDDDIEVEADLDGSNDVANDNDSDIAAYSGIDGDRESVAMDVNEDDGTVVAKAANEVTSEVASNDDSEIVVLVTDNDSDSVAMAVNEDDSDVVGNRADIDVVAIDDSDDDSDIDDLPDLYDYGAHRNETPQQETKQQQVVLLDDSSHTVTSLDDTADDIVVVEAPRQQLVDDDNKIVIPGSDVTTAKARDIVVTRNSLGSFCKQLQSFKRQLQPVLKVSGTPRSDRSPPGHDSSSRSSEHHSESQSPPAAVVSPVVATEPAPVPAAAACDSDVINISSDSLLLDECMEERDDVTRELGDSCMDRRRQPVVSSADFMKLPIEQLHALLVRHDVVNINY